MLVIRCAGALLLFLAATATFSFGQEAPGARESANRPNIIFILTDDQRWDALGYAGNSLVQTPVMDDLAARGTYFSHAMVTTPICSASRASILAGVHERAHRYTFQTGPLREEFMTASYPILMGEAGYYTGFFGKFGVNYSNSAELFDVFESYDRNTRYDDRRGYYYKTLDSDTVHLTRYTGQQALDFIDQAPPNQPFCLSLSFSAPHAHDGAEDQYFWQESQDELLAETAVPGPELGEDKWFDILPQPVREGFNRTRWYWRYDTPEKYQHSVKGYYRMINGIDDEIARIREKLAEKGLAENTVIILMGDNGYFLGERQLAGKWLMYDNSVRVPLIVYDPRVPEHRDISEMALNIDVPATMLDLAGVERPAQWQGKSLFPLVTGQSASLERDTVLLEHLWPFENIPPSEGVRTQRWKYFRYVDDRAAEELYDLEQDPKETANLADDAAYANVLVALRQKTDQLALTYSGPFAERPYGLHVETIRDPKQVAIVDSRPELGWKVPSSAVYQKGYQVLLASSKAAIDNNHGDVWDSGTVRSSHSNNIGIETDLHPNTTYFWKVRIFDKDNRLSDYSVVQEFSTGDFQGDAVTTSNYFQVEAIHPVRTHALDDGSTLYDFGKAAFGALELHYRASTTETLRIRLGEKLEHGRIDRDPGGTIRYQEVILAVNPDQEHYAVELVPDERNTNDMAVALPDSFPVIMPFRYVEIEGAEQPIQAEQLVQRAYFNYFDEGASAFTSSDTILNQVWDLCKYSIKATTFAGLYVDGDRERIPYEADAYLNQLSHYGVDQEYAMARRTIEYFMKKPTWPTEWQLHVALMFYQDYQYTGNTELIERYYEAIKHKTLMALELEDGLISTASPKHDGALMADLGFQDTTQRLRDIVDWPQKGGFGGVVGEDDGFVFRPVNAVINALYYENMRIMAEFARILGRTADQLDFQSRAARVKESFNEKLFNETEGYYRDGIGTDHGSVHANMFPLAFGLVPEKYQPSVVDHIQSRGMACSVYGAQYLMEGLYRAGAADYALELLTATHDRSWYNMIKSGSTITMEAWDMTYKPNADWNHAWGAVPANIIPRKLWGIEPAGAGFETVRIHPQLGDLESSSIMVPSPKGSITCSYVKQNERNMEYLIELPANLVGTFEQAFSPNHVVTLNGQPVNLLYDSLRLEPGLNQISIRINSF